MKIIDVVAAVIIDDDGKILIAKRKKGKLLKITGNSQVEKLKIMNQKPIVLKEKCMRNLVQK